MGEVNTEPENESLSPSFSVDTHLFQELGELLVGRDSTALVELIKNSYDADATIVSVYGENLNSPDVGKIIVADNGIGMNAEQFRKGFLTIASRFKSASEVRSPRFQRRYTGAKGIGRLAAHKLASFIEIDSTPYIPSDKDSRDYRPIQATIDWDAVEEQPTLDSIAGTGAITLRTGISPSLPSPATQKNGTTLTLNRLRRKWTPAERTRFMAEVTSFTPPVVLLSLPEGILSQTLLFNFPRVRDSKENTSDFNLELIGDFETGEAYWLNLAETAHWIIEIDATRHGFSSTSKVKYGIAPTARTKGENPQAEARVYEIEHGNPIEGPFFQARIFVREGALSGSIDRIWAGRSQGIRVFMEGFRVLPYGESGNDWLEIEKDYSTRIKSLRFLNDFSALQQFKDEGLSHLPNDRYFGAVFLTVDNALGLRMLVNREGFIPDASYDELVRLVRIGIDLCTRTRAFLNTDKNEERRTDRREKIVEEVRQELREQVNESVKRASELASQARQVAAQGNFVVAEQYIQQAAKEFNIASASSERLMTEGSILRVMASVGTQMSAFVHEINGLLGTANAVEEAFDRLLGDSFFDARTKERLSEIRLVLGDLRRSIERQASYLTDVVSPDARRRRSRIGIHERFDVACRLISSAANRRNIEIIDQIPQDLKTPPMFPAEVTVVFSNLLTNAIKAAGDNGSILAWADRIDKRQVRFRLENTGATVLEGEGERWFYPFESTTTEIDPVLGQGMGMGLPITRNILAEYGGIIRFAQPREGYNTALEIIFQE